MSLAKKARKLLFKPRIIILLIALFFAIIAISPNPFASGAMVTSVERDSPAFSAGMRGSGDIIKEIIYEGQFYTVNSANDYYDAISGIQPGSVFLVQTTNRTYRIELQIFEHQSEIMLPGSTLPDSDSVGGIGSSQNETSEIADENETAGLIGRNLTIQELGITVGDVPKSKIRQGLELSGGTRIVLLLKENVTETAYESLVDNIRQRIDVFGISDVLVRPARDLSGQQYVIVEMPSVQEQEIRDLLLRQGKFEAKIGDEVVFTGGERDVRYVCRTAACSGIDPFYGCQDFGGEWLCRFRFEIALSPSAAQRQAEITRNLSIIQDFDEGYLEKNLTLLLDDEKVDELRISASLRGRAETSIVITGSGTGLTRRDATEDALLNMRRLQTVMETGSLPTELEIVKVDTISPSLGAEFVRNSLIVGLAALIVVIGILVFAYRRIALILPIAFTMVSELVLILGFASLISWNLDLASIAGLIVAIGTGVDDQIVITDEALRKESKRIRSWRDRLKTAFFIIMGAYFTALVAMVPLFTAGAGLLRGFALTSIVGISMGVFLTRPAFAEFLEVLFEDEKENHG